MKQDDKWLYSLSGPLKRYGICMLQVIEIKAVIEEFWMHRLAAINSGLAIFNMSVLLVLLYNPFHLVRGFKDNNK